MEKFLKLLCVVLIISMVATIFASCVGQNGETTGESQTESQIESQTESETESGVEESESGSQTESEESRETRPEMETPKSVNICCIGDSITQGPGTYSAYRYYLYEMLYSAGCTFKFTGSEKSNDPRLPEEYSYHGGCGGAVIGPNTAPNARSTYDYLPRYLKTNGEADIALVMIGHNNYYRTVDVDNIDTVYKRFIERVFEISPDIILYCGTMIAQASGTAPDASKGYGGTKGLNGKLGGLIKDMIKEDPDKYEGQLYFVDLYENTKFLPRVDFSMSDSVHPNEKGQERLAKSWYDAIVDKVLEMNAVGDPSYKDDSVRVNGVTLETTAITIGIEEQETIKGSVTPSNADIFTLLWSSSDESVATVDTVGNVTGIKKGTCVITARTLDGGYTAKCEVTVINKDKYDYETLFSDTFEDAVTRGKWEGKTESYLYNTPTQLLLWRMARTFDINTVSTFSGGTNFRITAYVKITDAETVTDTNYVGIGYDKLQLRIMSAGTAIKVMYDGKEIASQTIEYKAEYNKYSIQYVEGVVYVFYNGKLLIERSVDGDIAASSKINLYSKEPNRCVNINNLILEAAK